MAPGAYTFIVVRTDGQVRRCVAQGDGAESMFDREFTEAKKDKRTQYAIVFDAPESIRQQWVRPKEIIEGGIGDEKPTY